MKSLRRPVLAMSFVLAAISISIWTAVPRASAHAEPQFPPGFKLRGTFAGGYEGFLLFNGTILNHNGIESLTFDGAGNFTGTETFNILGTAGQLTCVGTLSGTEDLGGDGTGTLALTFTANANQPGCPPSSSADSSFVVSDNGRTIDLVTTGNVAPQNAIHVLLRHQ